MMPSSPKLLLAVLAFLGFASGAASTLAQSSGDPATYAAWDTVTVDIAGPQASETGQPNPFTSYRFDVVFRHESGQPVHRVPGYFAADGNAAETSATQGNVWRAHLTTGQTGRWSYQTEFHKIDENTIDENKIDQDGVDQNASMTPLSPYHHHVGEFVVNARHQPLHRSDFRRRGRLQYVGGHHLRFAGDGSYFLKLGADSPETLLAFSDFDDTYTQRNWVPVRGYQPHRSDWRPGDPTWKDGKGKGLIGAMNYLSDVGVNGVSLISYNVGGDGRNVWPMIAPDEKLRYDCSKLDQWNIVLSHAQSRGLHLNIKLQETENDDNTLPESNESGTPKSFDPVPESMDAGELGIERRLYFREMIARFGHHLALTWNLGEENSQTTAQQQQMAAFFKQTDPYDSLRVIHTFPNEQETIYPSLLGDASALTGAALQNPWHNGHQRTLRWVRASAAAGKPWVVCHDEQNPWQTGVPPDAGYPGYDGKRKDGSPVGYGRARRSSQHAMGQPDGRRWRRRILLWLGLAPGRLVRRGLAKPRELVEVRAHRAGLLRRQRDPVLADDQPRRLAGPHRRGRRQCGRPVRIWPE